jgi:hypothetical protein
MHNFLFLVSLTSVTGTLVNVYCRILHYKLQHTSYIHLNASKIPDKFQIKIKRKILNSAPGAIIKHIKIENLSRNVCIFFLYKGDP